MTIKQDILDVLKQKPKTAREISIELNKPLENILSYITNLKKQEKLFKIKGSNPNIYTIEKPKKKQPKPKKIINLEDVILTQDDIWTIYKYLTHKGTRESKRVLLPKLIKLFQRNLRNL